MARRVSRDVWIRPNVRMSPRLSVSVCQPARRAPHVGENAGNQCGSFAAARRERTRPVVAAQSALIAPAAVHDGERPASSTLSQLRATTGGRPRSTRARRPSPSSSASVISTPTRALEGIDSAASSTAATPLALSSVPSFRAPTIDSISGEAPSQVSNSKRGGDTVVAVRQATARARAVRSDRSAVAITPATRANIDTGCHLESRCATSHTAGSSSPRRASRLTPRRRRAGKSRTPFPPTYRSDDARDHAARHATRAPTPACAAPEVQADRRRAPQRHPQQEWRNDPATSE